MLDRTPEPSRPQLSPHSAAGAATEGQFHPRAEMDFEDIYRKYSSRVHTLCLRMLRNPVEAEDLTQDIFLQVFRKLDSFRGDSSFYTWLYRLATNQILMHLRKKKLQTVSLDESNQQDGETWGAGRDVIETLPAQPIGLIDRVRLERAIDQLSADQRVVFVLHEIYGYQHKETAEFLECSIETSKSHLHRARLRLRELLQGLGTESSAQKETQPPRKARAGTPRTLDLVYSEP